LERESDDIRFSDNNHEFNLRAAGIIERKNQLLVCETTSPSADFVFIGGRVKFGESSKAAIQREFSEELHVNVQIKRLLWVIEHQVHLETESFQQVILLYLLAADDSIPDQTNKGTLTAWKSLSELQQTKLQPPIFKFLKELPKTTQYWQDIS